MPLFGEIRSALEFCLWVAGSEPGDEIFGTRHGGKAAVADEGEVFEKAGLFDCFQRGGRVEARDEFHVDDPGFWIVWVEARGREDHGQSDYGRFAEGMVKKHIVAFRHRRDGPGCEGVGDAVPDGGFVPDEVIDGVGVGGGFGEEERHWVRPYGGKKIVRTDYRMHKRASEIQ